MLHLWPWAALISAHVDLVWLSTLTSGSFGGTCSRRAFFSLRAFQLTLNASSKVLLLFDTLAVLFTRAFNHFPTFMNVSLTTRFKGQSSDSQDGSEFMTADECEFNTFRSVQDWRETIGSKALSVSFEFNNHQCFEKMFINI